MKDFYKMQILRVYIYINIYYNIIKERVDTQNSPREEVKGMEKLERLEKLEDLLQEAIIIAAEEFGSVHESDITKKIYEVLSDVSEKVVEESLK